MSKKNKQKKHAEKQPVAEKKQKKHDPFNSTPNI